MEAPAYPSDEPKRIHTLRSLNILDTNPEERFDRLTRLAKRLFGVPIALVSLIDSNRQWFKSCQGLSATETSREISFCGHAILEDGIFVINNALLDERFRDNPLVVGEPNIRFYAGIPLTVPNGSKLGTLCLIDRDPREMSQEDRELLRDLGRMAEQEIAALQFATMDDLTLLSNRRGFAALGLHTLNLCQRLQKPATLFLFDLNDFKPINDTYGHAEGDRALMAFAGILQEIFRESDVIGRLGGDEFVALLSQSSNAQIEAILQRLDQALATYNRHSNRGYEITYSVGVANFAPQQPQSLEKLLDLADQRMYAQKHQKQMHA